MPSLHIQLLHHLTQRIAARQRALEERVGKGLEDREYQRCVGRIAQCKLIAEDVEELLKGGIDALDELTDLEADSAAEKRRDRAKRRPQGS